MQQFKIITEAASAPVSVEQLRDHLLLFGDTSFDTELAALILAAQRILADEIGEFPTLTEIQQPYSVFEQRMELTHRFVETITSVQYYDSANTLQLLPVADYIFDDTGRKKFVLFPTLPTVTLSTVFPFPVLISYEAAMPEDALPVTVNQAILICAAEMWYQRANTSDSARFPNAINGSFLVAAIKRRT